MDIVSALRAIVGEANVLTEEADKAGYLVDWSNRFHGKTAAVVRPANTEEVSRVMALAYETARSSCRSLATPALWAAARPRKRATRFFCRFRA